MLPPRSALEIAIDKDIMVSPGSHLFSSNGVSSPQFLLFSASSLRFGHHFRGYYQSLTRSCLELNVLFDRPLAHWRLLFFWS